MRAEPHMRSHAHRPHAMRTRARTKTHTNTRTDTRAGEVFKGELFGKEVAVKTLKMASLKEDALGDLQVAWSL